MSYTVFDNTPDAEKLADPFILDLILLYEADTSMPELSTYFNIPESELEVFFLQDNQGNPSVANMWLGALGLCSDDDDDATHLMACVQSVMSVARSGALDYVTASDQIGHMDFVARHAKNPADIGAVTWAQVQSAIDFYERQQDIYEEWFGRAAFHRAREN